MARRFTGPRVTEMGVDFAPAPPDGSCFFHAVGAQVGLTAAQVRARFADYYDTVATDPARSQQFIRERGQGVGSLATVVRDWRRHIIGYTAPDPKIPLTAQVAVRSYADSIRAGAWGGEVEQAVIPIVFPGYTVRVYRPTANGTDVEHIYTNGPGFVARQWYRQCFPDGANGRCINLLAANPRLGQAPGHYDWLRRSQAAINARPAAGAPAPAPAVAAPAVAVAAPVSRARMTKANVEEENAEQLQKGIFLSKLATAKKTDKEKNAIVDIQMKLWKEKRPERRLQKIIESINKTAKDRAYREKAIDEVRRLSATPDNQFREKLKEISLALGQKEDFLQNAWDKTYGGRRKTQRRSSRRNTRRQTRHKRR